jgi:ABC-type glycerol-3-phosphate transport system substrate-binding protein
MSVNVRSRDAKELRIAFTAEAWSTLRKVCFSIALTFAVSGNRTDAGEARPAWQQDWEKTVQAAKSEGQVTVYVHSTYGPVLTSGAFEKAFPGIKLTMVSGVENDLERRFTAERRAGKNLADVFMVGVLRS